MSEHGRESYKRTISCTECEGDGGFYRLDSKGSERRADLEYFTSCPHCGGSGEETVRLFPITLQDLENHP